MFTSCFTKTNVFGFVGSFEDPNESFRGVFVKYRWYCLMLLARKLVSHRTWTRP
ncbi:hypothetical protein HanRHA438_Chr12g0566071 [Helianthus annuus]|nr:hypothetical protein HanRHA438_Chr12g0566071 [Helianthus annuus]